jgi:2-polyprenyl-3-methyl-5-hydroxy-6-metoxy-1,4-benzoquinol methylase
MDQTNLICRICDHSEFSLVLDLGNQPWGNGFIPPELIELEKSYPLKLVRCHACETAQLDFTVSKEIMFLNHTYLSGVTKTLEEHFRETAHRVHESFLKGLPHARILDIGSNDGQQLKQYQDLGYEVLGVESAIGVSKIANAAGIPTLNKFFNLETAKDINSKFDIINASGVFFHLEELHSVTEGIKFLLSPNGVFVVQFIYMKLMQDNVAFDQIYHEHLLYYNLKTIEILLDRHGLAMFDAYISPIHGGSVIGYVTHKGHKTVTQRLSKLRKIEIKAKANSIERYEEFALAAKQSKSNTRNWIQAKKREGKTIFGLGAPVKGNTLLNFFDLGVDDLPYLIERNYLRRNLVSPGKHIPVVMEDEIDAKPDAYLVLAWNFKKEILERHADDVKDGIEFFFPVEPSALK